MAYSSKNFHERAVKLEKIDENIYGKNHVIIDTMIHGKIDEEKNVKIDREIDENN